MLYLFSLSKIWKLWKVLKGKSKIINLLNVLCIRSLLRAHYACIHSGTLPSLPNILSSICVLTYD